MTTLIDRPDIKLWTEEEDGEEVLKLWVLFFYGKDIEVTWLNFAINFETECELVVRPLDPKNHTFFTRKDFNYIRTYMNWLSKSLEEFVGKRAREIFQSFASDNGINLENLTDTNMWSRINTSDVSYKLIVPHEPIEGVEQESKWVVEFKVLNSLYLSVRDYPNKYVEVVGRLFEVVNEEKMSEYLPSTQQTLKRIFEEFFRSPTFEDFIRSEFWISLKTHPESPIRTLGGHPVTYECHVKEGPRLIYYHVLVPPERYPFGANEYTIPLPPNAIQNLKERKRDDKLILSSLSFYLSFFPDLASKIVVREVPMHSSNPEGRSSHPLWNMNILLEDIREKLSSLE